MTQRTSNTSPLVQEQDNADNWSCQELKPPLLLKIRRTNNTIFMHNLTCFNLTMQTSLRNLPLSQRGALSATFMKHKCHRHHKLTVGPSSCEILRNVVLHLRRVGDDAVATRRCFYELSVVPIQNPDSVRAPLHCNMTSSWIEQQKLFSLLQISHLGFFGHLRKKNFHAKSNIQSITFSSATQGK